MMRESNSRPPAPKAGIIPLDQSPLQCFVTLWEGPQSYTHTHARDSHHTQTHNTPSQTHRHANTRTHAHTCSCGLRTGNAREGEGTKHNKKSDTFSICACHPCAGAMLIFSVSFQFYRMRRFLHRSKTQTLAFDPIP